MVKSVERFDFKSNVMEIEKINNNWLDTIYWRPEFILLVLWKYKQDVVWLDCDATMERYPDLFDNFKDDFGIHVHDFRWRKNEYLGGTMYFAHNERSMGFLTKWIKFNKAQPKDSLSQWAIPKVIKQCPELKVQILPESYCNIFDHINCQNPVITHWQASRKFRND